MAVDWRTPYSSTIARIGHDPDTDEMHVEWNSRKPGRRVSIYSGISAAQFEQGIRSPSVGAWLHSDVKPRHSHRYAE